MLNCGRLVSATPSYKNLDPPPPSPPPPHRKRHLSVVVLFKELLFFRIEPNPAHTGALLYPPCPRSNFRAIIRLETLATQARFPTWYCFGCTRQAVRPILCKQMQTTLNCNVIGQTFRLHPPRCVTPWGTLLRKWKHEKMGKRKGHAWCEILARGISGFLRKAGREVPLFLENTNTGTLRNVASYCSLRSETLYLLFRLFSAGNDFRLWYSFEGSVCKGKRKANNRSVLSWMPEGKRAFKAAFRKRRNVELLERLWPDQNQKSVA